MTHTKETLDKFEEREDWCGHGYLGGFLWRTDETDEILLAAANEADLTEEQFFEFCNSKPGRKLDESFEDDWPVQICTDENCGIYHNADGNFSSQEGAYCEDCGAVTTRRDASDTLHSELTDFLRATSVELAND